MTRRRHQLPPQPFNWFRNLAACCRELFNVRVASLRGRPIAAMITLQLRDTVVYKYGASDAAFHALGGMHFLFWKAITDACAEGRTAFDFGRSDPDQTGLLTFKDRWGAARVPVSVLALPGIPDGGQPAPQVGRRVREPGILPRSRRHSRCRRHAPVQTHRLTTAISSLFFCNSFRGSQPSVNRFFGQWGIER